MRLFYKLFLGTFITYLVVVVLFAFTIGYQLVSGFNTLITEIEYHHLVVVRNILQPLYKEENGWSNLRNNEEKWEGIVQLEKEDSFENMDRPPEPPPAFSENGKEGSLGEPPGPPPPGIHILRSLTVSAGFLHTGDRITLFDLGKNIIMGKEALQPTSIIEPIDEDGQLVGWIGLVPFSLDKESAAQLFFHRQYLSYLLVTLISGVLLSGIMAFFFSQYLSTRYRLEPR